MLFVSKISFFSQQESGRERLKEKRRGEEERGIRGRDGSLFSLSLSLSLSVHSSFSLHFPSWLQGCTNTLPSIICKSITICLRKKETHCRWGIISLSFYLLHFLYRFILAAETKVNFFILGISWIGKSFTFGSFHNRWEFPNYSERFPHKNVMCSRSSV